MNKHVVSALTLSLASTFAMAGSFEAQDTDDNGKLSKDEFYGTVSDVGLYSDWDADNDGLINEYEFDDIGVDYDFTAWDANGDWYLDADEFYEGTYTSFDENEDGHWDGNEWDDAGDAGWLDV